MAPTLIGRLMGTNAYKGSAKRALKLQAGEGVMLDRRPDNPYDSNAVAVLSAGEKMLGHIDRVTARTLAQHMDAGTIYVASVVTPAEGWRQGPYLCVRKGSCTIRCVPLPPLLKTVDRLVEEDA
jgi:hypothetical protein